MSTAHEWNAIGALFDEARFDELLIPVYAEPQRPTYFRLFAFAVYLRSGDRYLRLTQIAKNQGDQLGMAVVDAIEHDPSLTEEPDITTATVDVTSQYLGDISSFRVLEATAYLNERSDLGAGLVTALSITTDYGKVLFDPLDPLGVRLSGGAVLPDLLTRYAERHIPARLQFGR